MAANNSALTPVQAKFFALLDADGPLDAALGNGKIYDHVPAQTAFPYLTITELRERPDDTLGTKGRMVRVTLDVYSQEKGYKQIETICEEVIRILDNDKISGLADGWIVDQSIYVDGGLDRLEDGLTRHAELIFDVGVYK